MTINNSNEAPDFLLTSREVRGMFGGVSDMSLWRWLQDSEMGFPKPLIMRRRRYWRQADILAFQQRQMKPQAAE